MPLSKSARRRARSGKGLLPPNPKQWNHEHNALDLREELGIEPGEFLSHATAFALLENVVLLPHGSIWAAEKYLSHFRHGRSAAWSGMSLRLPSGIEYVVYNDSHSLNRVRATLLEEYFHIRLDHPRSILRLHSDDGRGRSHDPRVEQEAYCSGAAALVPYCGLREMLDSPQTAAEIADCYQVSRDLVVFRAKVTRLYSKLKRSDQ